MPSGVVSQKRISVVMTKAKVLDQPGTQTVTLISLISPTCSSSFLFGGRHPDYLPTRTTH